MNPLLFKLVSKILTTKSNPGEMVDGTLLLQVELIQSGERYSEDDLFEALKKLGADELEMASWFERYASWV
jgi:hypothetical protein